MINVTALSGSLSFIIKSVVSVRSASIVQNRLYSIYPPYYVKPVYKKDQQDALKDTPEAAVMAHTPILPAHSAETSSAFHDVEVSKFINYIMRKGKKNLARELLAGAFTNVKRIQLKAYHAATPEKRSEIELDPIKIFYRAVENATPVMELMRMKRGGVTYQVPVPILQSKQRFLAMNWLIQAAKEKHRKIHLPETLAKELIDAAHNQGRVVKRKQDLHKQCEANRAYAHYRWL